VSANQASLGERIPWLPDETLFSWCSRYHHLAVNGLASATCLQLFGVRRRGVAHDLPDSIGALARRAEGSLGAASDICTDRTLLAFYAPFRPMALVDQAQSQLIDGSVAHLKYQLGMLTSGLGAAHPLKACPCCMKLDRQQFGVAHWRRTHQLPSSWYCEEHSTPLLVSPIKLDQRARFQWALPMGASLVPWATGPSSLRSCELGLRMAAFGAALCRLPASRLANAQRLAQGFRSGLSRCGVLSRTGRVSWADLQAHMGQHVAALNMLPPFAMQLDVAVAAAQLTRILSGRGLAHPLRYIAWLCLFFDSLDEFIDAYDAPLLQAAPANTARAQVDSGQADASKDGRAVAAVTALLSGGESMTAIANRLGVEPGTVAVWAARAGLQTARRPKKLDDERWSSAIDLLVEGGDKRDVALRIGMSEVTVTRILRIVPGLQELWHEVRHEAARVRAREAWLRVVSAEAVIGRASARRVAPAAFAWLYRNDREWLHAQSSHLPSVQLGNGSTHRRHRADERYAHNLETALASAQLTKPGFSMRISDWAIIAPGLRKVAQAPSSWPLTVCVLRRLLGADSFDDDVEPLWARHR